MRAHLVLVAVNRRVTERVQLLLRLAHERVQPRLHVRQLVPDMVHEDLVERLREVLRPVLVRDVAVRGVGAEELGLGVERVRERLVRVDVCLRAVHDADEAELERVDAPGEDVERVRACVHEVELGEHADRASALGVDGARELEGF